MATSPLLHQILSEATARRLYNTVMARDKPSSSIVLATPQNSIESITSSNEFNISCRICRWNRSDMELKKCPCQCKGSVGFIHFPCLKRWIMHRRGDNHCEICSAAFDIPKEKFCIRPMIKSLLYRCTGPILKHLLFIISLLPLSHAILHQVINYMENIIIDTSTEDIPVKEVMLAASALITSTALFCQFFEFLATRIVSTQSILRQWWHFGNQSDFALIRTDSEIFYLFF